MVSLRRVKIRERDDLHFVAMVVRFFNRRVLHSLFETRTSSSHWARRLATSTIAIHVSGL